MSRLPLVATLMAILVSPALAGAGMADHYCNTSDVLSFPHEPVAPRVVVK